jgi:hypothetical protein
MRLLPAIQVLYRVCVLFTSNLVRDFTPRTHLATTDVLSLYTAHPLIARAVPPPPPPPSGSSIVKQGWLQKSDPRGGRWKQRWCVLLTNALYYYSDADMKDSKLKGAFELKQSKLVMGWDVFNKRSPTAFVFQLQLPQRQYFFCAATQAEMLEWKAAIESVLGTGSGLPQSPVLGANSGGVLYDADSSARGLSSATSQGGSNRALDSSDSGPASSFGVPMYSPSAFGAGVAPRQPLLNAVDAPQGGAAAPENISLYVLYADPARGTDKTYTIMVRADKVASLTFATVRRNLAKTVGVSPDRIVLTVDGNATPIEDSWSGQGLLHHMVKLRMTLLPAASSVTAGASAASAVPQVSPSLRGRSLQSVGSALPTASPLLSASTGSARRLMSSSASVQPQVNNESHAAAIAALDRRARLRKVFDSVAGGGRSSGAAAPSTAVSSADLAQALSADPEVAAMPEHEALLWRLLSAGGAPGSSSAAAAAGPGHCAPLRVTWDAFSALLDLATADAEAGRPIRAQSPPAKRSVPAVPQSTPGLSSSVTGVSPAPVARAGGSSAVPAAAVRVAAASPAPRPALPAPAAASSSAAAAATEGGANGGPRHVMIIKVDVPGGTGEAFMRIRAGDDARALAAAFIREHGLSAADYMDPLVEEVRRSGNVRGWFVLHKTVGQAEGRGGGGGEDDMHCYCLFLWHPHCPSL